MLWVINMKNKYRDLILIIVFVFVLCISINVYAASETCTGVFKQSLIDDMNKYVYTPIKWLTPVLLLILTSIDFAGVVFNGKKDSMDKAKNNFLKRAVAALIIFFAPDLINLIVKLINNQSISSCMSKLK